MQPLTSEDRADVLIVDDSLYSRNRSKKVELLARVYDHAAHRFVRGFRMLTLGWSDGNSFVPFYGTVRKRRGRAKILASVRVEVGTTA